MNENTVNIPQIKPSEGENIPPKNLGSNSDSDGINQIRVDVEKRPNQGLLKEDGQKTKIRRFDFSSMTRKKKIVLGVIAFISVFLIYNVFSFIKLSRDVKNLMVSAKTLKTNLAMQDLNLVKSDLTKSKEELNKVSSSYKLISWAKIIPFFGSYVSDGQHVLNAGKYGVEVAETLIDVVTPYADLIGFSGGATDGGGETASDRIDFLVSALPDILPRLDEITSKLSKVDEELLHIRPSRYPVKFAGREIRSNVETALDTYGEFSRFLKEGKPIIQNSPYLLGLDGQREYLVIFQNDKELRPSGGFITAYSIMNVEKAKFDPTSSDDIYNLDRRYDTNIKAPDPIIDYIQGPYTVSNKLFLRDMNWSPDFEKSMDLFSKEVESVGLEDIDGIIAVDTQLLVNLIKVLGTIPVAGFGNFSDEIIPECNCPQVIYELESFADVEGPIVWDPAGTGKIIYKPPNSDNRKKIIGPLMNAIMASAFGSPKEKMPELFDAFYKSVTEKHILMYMKDEKIQESVAQFGMAGTVTQYDVDYLNINDANLGGRKSNLYVTQSVHQQVDIAKDGSVEKTLEITYQNPERFDGWLNSVLPNWTRIYVPKGSELVESSGLENMSEPYEDLGYTVYAGYFELRPQGVVKVSLKYKLPFKISNEYKILIQKQPGKDAPQYSIDVNKKSEEFLLNTDKEFKFKI